MEPSLTAPPFTLLRLRGLDINILRSKRSNMSYDRFIDERLLTSRDALNRLQIKIKLVEIDENARDFSQRFGRRVLVKKVLLTIKHTETEEVDARGWRKAVFGFDVEEMACEYAVSFGPQLEVIEPASLREKVIKMVQATLEFYRQ